MDIDDLWEAKEARENMLWEEFHQTYTDEQIYDELESWNSEMPEGEKYTYEEIEDIMFQEFCELRE